MSVIINRETRINNQGGQSQVVIGGASTPFSLPYVTITYDSSVYTFVRPLFTVAYPSIDIVDWGDGTIEYNLDAGPTHNYTPPGIYIATFYSQQFASTEVGCFLEESSGGGNVTNFDFTRTNTTYLKAFNSIIPSFTAGTTNTINYPNLQTFEFPGNTTFTYTAGMLGLYNPRLTSVDLSDCGFIALETNRCLVDMQTYCLNNPTLYGSGILDLGGANMAKPTIGPPNGVTAYNALVAAGWTVTTGSL